MSTEIKTTRTRAFHCFPKLIERQMGCCFIKHIDQNWIRFRWWCVSINFIFKRRAFPVWLGVGFGLGRGYAEGDAIFRSNHGLRTVKA